MSVKRWRMAVEDGVYRFEMLYVDLGVPAVQ